MKGGADAATRLVAGRKESGTCGSRAHIVTAGREVHVSVLTAFGVVAVTAMMIFYWLETRGIGYIFAFGVACLAASAYGWMAGTWPFGVVEIVWAAVAFARWNHRRNSGQWIK